MGGLRFKLVFIQSITEVVSLFCVTFKTWQPYYLIY